MRRSHRFTNFLADAVDSGARRPRIDTAAFVLLLAFIALAPFPFGGVLPSGKFRIEIAAFLTAAGAAFAGPRADPPRGTALPAALVAAIAALGFGQILPIPSGALRAVSPASVKIYHDAAELLASFGRAAPAPRISIAPGETAGAILLVLAYVALFRASTRLLANRARRRLFSAVLVASAAVQVGAAAASSSPAERIHGTFLNPDHFAGYLEIALALAFAGLWTEVLTGGDRLKETMTADRVERRLPPLVLRVLIWGFVAAGIALTRSRGGIAAAAAAGAVMLTIALATRRGGRGSGAAITIALALGLAFVAAAARREAVVRFLSADPREIGASMRVAIWKTSLAAWREFPVFGSGLGSFREAFRLVQPRGVQGLVEEAHDDGLQLLVTGGAVGFLLGAAAFGALYVLLGRFVGRQRHREEKAFVIAGIGALFSLTIHGLVDFNLSIPAVPATLAATLGLAFAAGAHESPGKAPTGTARRADPPPRDGPSP